jgi:hypothetical protein
MLTPKTLEMDMRPSAEAPDKTRRTQSIIPEETGFWRAAPPPSRTSLEYARVLLEACDLSRESLKVVFHDAPNDSTNSASTDLLPATDWAQSGAMALTGHPNTAPRFANGPLASAMRGAASVLAALAPNTPLVDLEGPALLGERAALFGLTRQGSESPGGSARLLPSQSASLVLNLPREDDWHLIPAWLEDPLDLGEIDLTHAVTSGSNHAAWTQIAERIAVRPAEQLIDRGRLMGLAVAPAPKEPPPNTSFFRLSQGSESSPPVSSAQRPPLRLLDLSTLWAGPLATSLLAHAGIDVLKIESPNRPDGARQGSKPFFDLMNGEKQGCALDLHEPRDRAHFEQLLDAADIVVESARPRALAQLGYDAEAWVTERTGRLWASITGYGREHSWIAFGDDAAISAGLAWSPIASESSSCFCADAIADPLTGLHTAAILLAHLRAGRGGLIDVSLHDIASRAATAEHPGLILPIEEHAGDWGIRDGDHAFPVALPRARQIHGTAPVLAAPSQTMLAYWTRR